ncbi:MAG: hypothetical protein K9J81_07065, partial [Desulfohalobiaceae bacterium]|nr:hypothetical protein [Desulfohalobiaceae bacterium]
MKYTTRMFSLALLLILAVGLVWLVVARLQEEGKPRERTEGPRAVPVEVAEIERGSIELRRTFSG